MSAGCPQQLGGSHLVALAMPTDPRALFSTLDRDLLIVAFLVLLAAAPVDFREQSLGGGDAIPQPHLPSFSQDLRQKSQFQARALPAAIV